MTRRTGRLIIAALITVPAVILSIGLARKRQQASLNAALIDAIRNSHADKVDSLLASGADPNARRPGNYNEPLIQQARYLFRRPPPDEGEPAIVMAVSRPGPHDRIIKALISHGANVNARYTYMGTALNMIPYYDTKFDQAEVLEILFKAGAFVDPRSFGETTPLMQAILYKRTAVIACLLNHNADMMAVDDQGEGPLLIACMHHRTENVQLLLDRGCRCDSTVPSGLNPATVKRLVSNADSLNWKRVPTGPPASQVSFVTPLSIAQREGYADIVTLLKAHGEKK